MSSHKYQRLLNPWTFCKGHHLLTWQASKTVLMVGKQRTSSFPGSPTVFTKVVGWVQLTVWLRLKWIYLSQTLSMVHWCLKRILSLCLRNVYSRYQGSFLICGSRVITTGYLEKCWWAPHHCGQPGKNLRTPRVVILPMSANSCQLAKAFCAETRQAVIRVVLHPEWTNSAWLGYIPLEVFGTSLSAPLA